MPKSKIKYLERPTQIKDLIRLGTTSDHDLKKIAEAIGINNLRVDWASNAPSLQDSIKNKQPAIWNIADNKIGTHWVASYGDQYFDPVGLAPDVQFTHYQWSPIQVQSYDSKYCGQYCLFWLWHAIRDDIPGFYNDFTALNKF